MKTKQQEIEILQSAIKQLGADSYLGPWLQDILGEVTQLVRSDFFPELSLKAAAEQARAVVSTAEDSAEQTLEIARNGAKAIVDQAIKTRDSAVAHLEKSVRELRGW